MDYDETLLGLRKHGNFTMGQMDTKVAVVLCLAADLTQVHGKITTSLFNSAMHLIKLNIRI